MAFAENVGNEQNFESLQHQGTAFGTHLLQITRDFPLSIQ
jgi:hypothetical protein